MAKPKGPISAKTIAAEKAYDEEHTTRLLDTLVSLNLVQRSRHHDGVGMFSYNFVTNVMVTLNY